MKHKIFFLLSIFFIFINTVNAWTDEGPQKAFSTVFCSVFYDNDVDLNLVNSRIKLKFSDFYTPRRYVENSNLPIEHALSDKFDAVFSRVEEVLDMYPSKIHVAINIYKTREALDVVYESIFNEPNTAKSFYLYKTNTIYTTEQAIAENIIAHEMAHCIIDHYFVILPPKKIQEILAVFADVHLND